MTSVGQPVDRLEGPDKVTGRARYAADHDHPGLVHAVIVQSTIGRGEILSIDTAPARRLPGVLAILTHENAPRLQEPKAGASSPQEGKMGELLLPFSTTRIHFAGQHLAVVVAERLEQAQEAAARVRVRYREEVPVLDLDSAQGSATRPQKALGGVDVQHRRGDPESILASPDVVKIEATYVIPVETNNPMEPSATVARWEGDRLTVEDSTQAVIGTRNLLATVFSLPPENVRVICPFTGGGFGCKGHQWPHTLIAALAARAVGRPVKLALTRGQMFTSVGHRPYIVQKIAMAAHRDGRLAAIRHETVNATSPVTEFVAPCGAVTSKLLYACDNVATPNTLVRFNMGAPTPMRAPAEAPGMFALESAMDELSEALGVDPLELRRRNHADRDPAEGKPWSSKHLEECYRLGAERFGWARRSPAPGSMHDGPLLVGWGMATAFYPGHRRPASARVRIGADGRVLVQAATQEVGGGSYTVFAQLAADALDVPLDLVRVELGDSRLPEAPFSAGSVTVASVSDAVVRAAREAKAKRLAAPGTAVEAEAHAEADEAAAKAVEIHSFGAHFCEVKVDPALAEIRVTRFVSVMDVGRVLNLKTARSQIIGGVVWGIGMALLEHTVYDGRTGLPVVANLADYRIPVNADVQAIEVEFVGGPDPHINEVGSRGSGEVGITGAAAAVANAVHHATGRRVRDLPITPETLLA